MFTGIVEETGRVVSFHRGERAWSLRLEARVALGNIALGDSISVSGCCLTVVHFDERHLAFELLEETLRLTHFSNLVAGSRVNLERSLAFGGKMGGHFVTGHVDGVGSVAVFERRGSDYYLNVRVPEGQGRHLIHKGSIALEGISLTVAEVDADSFGVWLIPHTLEVTNLGERRVGDRVNLEYDLLGKYVEKLLTPRLARPN